MEWGQMLEPQQQAFQKIVDFISHAVHSIPKVGTGWEGGLGQNALDFHRSNSVVMLSGKRGTGKTSLFLTLRRLIRNSSGYTGDSEARSKKIHGPLDDQLRALRERVVWLDTLDLEPLPHRSSLLSAIFARIEEVIRIEHGDWDGFDSWTENPNAKGMEKAISDFDRLANEIAFAWDDGPGHGHPGNQNVEPEVVARELRRAERARLSIRQRLDDVLNQFARNVKWRNDVTNPLFILPVDDFDLNPKRCLELLRLLRAIDGARLFTIVLGEQTTAADVLNLRMYGELTNLVSHARFDDQQLKDLSRQGRVLANEAIRKLLPPDQRVVLSPLTLEETLKFRPILMDDELDGRSGELPNLRSLLDEVLKHTDKLGFRIVLESIDKDKNTSPDNIEYSGLNALKRTVRQLTDLWIALDQIERKFKTEDDQSKRGTAVIDLFWREFSTALRAEPKLPDAWREQLDEELRRFPPFIVELLLETRELATRRISFRDELRFELKKFEDFIVGQSAEDASRENRSRFYLGDEAKATFVLMSDIIRKDTGKITFVDHVRKVRDMDLAKSKWLLHDQKLSCSWCGPVFCSFYSAERFLQSWNRFSVTFEGGRSRIANDDINRMAYFWLLAGFAATTMEAEDWNAVRDLVESSKKAFPKVGTRKKNPLYQWIGKLTSTSNTSEAIDDWLITVAVLLAPENGIPDGEIAKKFAAIDRVNNVWRENAEFIRQERMEFAKSTQPTLLKLFLNPSSFEDEVRARLIRTAYLASTILSDQSELPIVIDIKSAVDAFAERMSQVHQGFESRFDKASRFFDKFLPEALEACTKVRRRLEEYISPDDPFSNVGPFKRELSDFLSMLRDANSLFEFLSASQLTQESTLNHPINKFEKGILCPQISALRALE